MTTDETRSPTPAEDQIPTIPVLFKFIHDELTAIFPSLPGNYGMDSMDAFVWADGFISIDLAYASSGEMATEPAYKAMHAYLLKRFSDDAILQVVETIEPQHHEERHARLKSSIEALKAGTGSPPWSPEGLAALKASAAALN